MKHIGQNIRILRHLKQWSQGQVAKQLKISIPAFSKIETGVTDINISRLEQIASLFEASIFEILSKPGDDRSKMHTEELNGLKVKLAEREQEVIRLQGKVISLFDELRNSPVLG